MYSYQRQFQFNEIYRTGISISREKFYNEGHDKSYKKKRERSRDKSKTSKTSESISKSIKSNSVQDNYK